MQVKFKFNSTSQETGIPNLPLLAVGFRAFFLLAGLAALLLIMLWKAIYSGKLPGVAYFPNQYWHAHEMLLGYTAAVIAGFLLTAVRNWTGLPTASGATLAGLCLLWLYGRIVPFYAGYIPDSFIAIIDFAFLPALAYQLSKPILQAKHYQSLVFIGLILLLIAGNGLMHLQALGWTADTAGWGVQLLVATVIVMILVIAGRIFPFFTERGLPGVLPLRNPLLDQLSIAAAVAVFVLQMADASPAVLTVAGFAAAAVNLWRVAGWHVFRVWYVPLLWILYIGYGWIILGFIFIALAAYQWVLPSLALHAFTMGGIGVLTLGMMARVSLGHTGRVLRVSKVIEIAFVAINLAVAVRLFVPLAFPAGYAQTVYLSITLWLLAFLLFAFVYAPILTAPRADGQPD
ncbi:MAG: NnrS family protein [Gammaproteobacteria bacterium]